VTIHDRLNQTGSPPWPQRVSSGDCTYVEFQRVESREPAVAHRHPRVAKSGLLPELFQAVQRLRAAGAGGGLSLSLIVTILAERVAGVLFPRNIQRHMTIRHSAALDPLHVAMRPVATYDGELVDFTLGNGGTALLLIGGDARPDFVLTGAVRVIFMRPRADAVASGVVPNARNELVKR